MSILGRGLVAIWNGVAPEGRAEFYEWHNREHMPERAAIPGFIRGRRYIAHYGHPEYFTLYEAENPEVLSGQDYLNRLDNPTPWTQKVVSNYFRDASRGICRLTFSEACGDGGYMLTLQFGPQSGRATELEEALRDRILPPLVDMPAVTGVHLCITDQAASDVETAERKGRSVAVPNWLIMIEAVTAEGADAACEMIVGLDTIGAAPGADRGLYVLQNCRAKIM
jgi:hypothetical protein